MKHRLDVYVQTGSKKNIITKCLHLKSHLNIVWTETHGQNPSKRPKNSTVLLRGFLHLHLVDETDCTLVSRSGPKQWRANDRTYSASALQAQKHTKEGHAGSLPCLRPPRPSRQVVCKQAIFVPSDHKYCFGKVSEHKYEMHCWKVLGRCLFFFFFFFFGFSIKAQRFLSGRGVEVQAVVCLRP